MAVHYPATAVENHFTQCPQGFQTGPEQKPCIIMNRFTSLFLGTTGLLYLALAIWCAFQPVATAAKVGFDLRGAAGYSEFITVYGGLEFGLAAFLLVGAVHSGFCRPVLACCILIHASLVVFRTASLVLVNTQELGDLPALTWQLAAGEWLILLLGLACWKFGLRQPAQSTG